eukprot:TRINITY_DN91011_c0_g1_i1.p1 TRINITY_DN91011_c0_g1~~TRINITY_DN91011_c0_g1_i1.p1  ORF type:complete len:603 (-),score=115.39 TRINITY_DN91011_c0_g1_i1:249-2057(-)
MAFSRRAENGADDGKDDDKVRVLYGESVDPWKTWELCSGPWKFPAGLMKFLADAGFQRPTPIQAYTWPVLVGGKDVIGVAKTGSGKTLGYLLPGYIKVMRSVAEKGTRCDQSYGPAMLILAPTRELCQQIYEESERFGKPAKIETACVYGGGIRNQQVNALWKGPHCVAATPGRLLDFAQGGQIKLGSVQYLVLDEADRMLDLGFEDAIKEISNYLPQSRQTALYTATWPREVRLIACSVTNNATHIQVGSTDAATTNSDIRQHVVKVQSEEEKLQFLQDIFKRLRSVDGSCLIFVKTKRAAASLYTTLAQKGAPIVCLHGDLMQRERDHALWAFKTGLAKVLVATDVAQRGLDIKNVQFVVNLDPPNSMEDYVHRIGRTGRAGVKGDAYTLLYERDWYIAKQIALVMRKAGQEVPAELTAICDSRPQRRQQSDAWENWTGLGEEEEAGAWPGESSHPPHELEEEGEQGTVGEVHANKGAPIAVRHDTELLQANRLDDQDSGSHAEGGGMSYSAAVDALGNVWQGILAESPYPEDAPNAKAVKTGQSLYESLSKGRGTRKGKGKGRGRGKGHRKGTDDTWWRQSGWAQGDDAAADWTSGSYR